jgi:hypothetical protein
MEPRNRFQGMNSASLCSLAGMYGNPIPTRFLAPIERLKIPAQDAARRCPFHICSTQDLLMCSIKIYEQDTIVKFARGLISLIDNVQDTWTLTLRNVQTEDRGPYMCQVNSTPVRKQVITLN